MKNLRFTGRRMEDAWPCAPKPPPPNDISPGHYGPGVDSDIFPGGKGGRCVRLTTLPPSCAVVMKSGNLKFLEPSGPLQACFLRLSNPSPNQEVQYEKSILDTSGEDYWIWATGSDSSVWTYQSVAGCFAYDRELAGFLKGMEEFLVYRPLPRLRKNPIDGGARGIEDSHCLPNAFINP